MLFNRSARANPFFVVAGTVSLAGLMLTLTQLISAQTAAPMPSQTPLINRDGGGVKPNIMLTMDDSGSMMFQHMPEQSIILGTQTVASPVGTRSVRMDPDDNATLSGFFSGTISGNPASTNYRQKLMRSPQTNTIYYNPEVRYLPWPLAAGGRMGNAAVAAAPRDPMNQAGGGTINLTNVRMVTSNSHVWCYRSGDGDNCRERDADVNYDPGLYYRLRKDTTGQYLDATDQSNYDQFSINTAGSPAYTRSAARTDCISASTSCSQAEERQNFANWFTYYRTRNLLAKGSVAEAFSESTDTFRLGYGRINKAATDIDGVSTRVIENGVRDFSEARKIELFNYLYALPASGGTPLRLAMQEVGNYYSRDDSKGPWSDVPGTANTTSDKSCRRAYQILVTDGYWGDTVGSGGLTAIANNDNTNGESISGPGQSYTYSAQRPFRDSSENTLADYAMKYWKNDLRPNSLDNKVVASVTNPAFWQHMVNFTVGLGVRGVLDPATDLPALTSGDKSWGSDKIDDLWHAAVNSRGEFFSAKDPSELARSIRSAIGQTSQRELREAGVAAAATTLQAGNRKYVPLYKSGAWTGDVQAFALDANGQSPATPSWKAEQKVPLPANRKIFTWDTGLTTPAAVPFTWSGMSTGNRDALGSVGVTYGSALVDFLRGNRSREGADQPFRERGGVLGDFINGNPVLLKGSVDLGYSTLPSVGASYAAFVTQKKARTAVLFAGSNDGMLHAFKDSFGAVPADDGKEVFAFVPRTVYPNLSKLSDKTYGTSLLYHQFYVDGPLTETDAYVPAPGAAAASWRNYLLGALGSGGRAVYALDVTDSANLDASAVRWEFSSSNDADLGHVYSAIETGVLPNGEWVAVFGNGSLSTAGKAVLFVANLATGAVQKLVVEDTLGSNGLSGVAVQKNSAGQITHLFAGDLKGKLWKFGYKADATSKFEVSGGTAIFSATSSAGAAQPITQPPGIFDHPEGGKMLVFGTGLLVTEADANSAAVQAIYSVWDKPSDSGFSRPMTRASLASRTIASFSGAGGATFYSVSGTAVESNSQRGWVIDLSTVAGLRVVNRPLRIDKNLVLISTLAPAQNVISCDASSGVGITFLLPVVSGVNPVYKFFDTNGDGVVGANDTSTVGFLTANPGGDRVYLPSDGRGAEGANGGSGGSGGEGGGGNFCPAKFKMGAILDATTGLPVCIPDEFDVAKIQDRVWRRIINPPIR